MVDPDDSLITMKMIQDFVQMNQGTEKPLEIGADVEIFTPFLGEKVKVDVQEKQLDLTTCVQILKKFWIQMLKPQEMSVSLRKLMVLTDETMQQDCEVRSLIVPKSSGNANFKHDACSQIVLVMENQCQISNKIDLS